MTEALREQVQQTRKALEAPIADLETLVHLLSAPLRFLNLIPSNISGRSSTAWDSLDPTLRPLFIQKHLPGLQVILLRSVYVDWKEQLEESGQLQTVFEQWFSPSASSHEAHLVALSAVSVILALFKEQSQTPLHILSVQHSLSSLGRATEQHSLEGIHWAFFNGSIPAQHDREQVDWLNAIKLYFSVPDRVANFTSAIDSPLQTPPALDWNTSMVNLTRSLSLLVDSSSQAEHIAPFLAKFINTGFLVTSPQTRSFWGTVLPDNWHKLFADEMLAHRWQDTVHQLPSREIQSVQGSLARHLLAQDYALEPVLQHPYALDAGTRTTIIASARLFFELLGPWDQTAAATFLEREGWPCVIARLLVSWATASKQIRQLLDQTASVWADKTSIERSSPQHREYLTCIILLCVASTQSLDPELVRFASSELFLTGVSAHLATTRIDIRFQGMLAAELVSQKTLDPAGSVKALDFGADLWQGNQPGLETCRHLRALALAPVDISVVSFQDVASPTFKEAQESPKSASTSPRPESKVRKTQANPSRIDQANTSGNTSKITVLRSQTLADASDDDEDLVPYAMPEEDVEQLKEDEDLGTYTPSKNKPKPPVYIADLSGYLKDTENAEKIEMGLKHAAPLIRKRANWGSELAEYAVDLSFALISLHNNFDLDNFSRLRQEAMIALVSCAPKEAAPTIIEQYYTQHYSVDQRFAMLTSLALGARELANLDPPKTTIAETFPSKQLPPALHQKLVEFEAGPMASSELGALSNQIASEALQNIRNSSTAHYGPTDAERKENMLSVQDRQQGRTRSSTALAKSKTSSTSSNAYASLAEPYFIMPLINRMWLTIHHGGSNDSLFLPLLLGRYFSTLSVLTHAASNSYALRRLLPEVLGLTLALQGVSVENDVVASQLELLVVCLQAAAEASIERIIMREMDTRELVFRAKAWAELVWRQEENKGSAMGRLGRNAAGVLLRCESLAML